MTEGWDEGPGGWGRVIEVGVGGCVGKEICVT